MACGAGVGVRHRIVTPVGAGSIPVARPTYPKLGAMVYQVSIPPCHGGEAGSSPASPANLVHSDTQPALDWHPDDTLWSEPSTTPSRARDGSIQGLQNPGARFDPAASCYDKTRLVVSAELFA